MTRAAPQLNIRSAFARERATDLARRTGLSTTRVVEEALRAWSPPAEERIQSVEDEEILPHGLVRKGRLLVLTAEGRRKIGTRELLRAIDDAREERADMVAHPDAY